MALQKKIYCIYQLNQYEISWDKYCQLYPSWDEACYLDSGSRKRQGHFGLTHRNRKQDLLQEDCTYPQLLSFTIHLLTQNLQKREKGESVRRLYGNSSIKARDWGVAQHDSCNPHKCWLCAWRWGGSADKVTCLQASGPELNPHQSNSDTLFTGVS